MGRDSSDATDAICGLLGGCGAHVADLEAQPAQHFGRAGGTAAELMRADAHAGRELIGHAKNRLGIIAAPAGA
jgi:hypothetical protein